MAPLSEKRFQLEKLRRELQETLNCVDEALATQDEVTEIIVTLRLMLLVRFVWDDVEFMQAGAEQKVREFDRMESEDDD